MDEKLEAINAVAKDVVRTFPKLTVDEVVRNLTLIDTGGVCIIRLRMKLGHSRINVEGDGLGWSAAARSFSYRWHLGGLL
jgi:hypothetical protein